MAEENIIKLHTCNINDLPYIHYLFNKIFIVSDFATQREASNKVHEKMGLPILVGDSISLFRCMELLSELKETTPHLFYEKYHTSSYFRKI
jgi:hypothetical protein